MRNQCLECMQWFQSLFVTNLCQKCGGKPKVITPDEKQEHFREGDLLDEILN